ncbi:MAG TPA: SDR family NAD(P)-dependent oxidoreductase [Armatimonadota bacterium]|nr:SDR family NAD(P)-dependent oxidoreductase [Armatimonadota bacterium]
MTDLAGKVAIVTGGARGIGRAAAEALYQAGTAVAIADLDEPGAVEAARSLGEKALGLYVDVASAEAVQAMVDQVMKVFGGVDILVNSAGICRRGRMLEIPEKEWDLVLAINLKGTFLCCRAALPSMIERGWGRIVNVASISGKIGGLMVGVHYAASKGGVLALTKGLAREVAPHGITVNSVCPALVDTDMSSLFTDEELKTYIGTVPLRRLGKPEDVAQAILYLCSEEASYITGEVLDINGGLLMD